MDPLRTGHHLPQQKPKRPQTTQQQKIQGRGRRNQGSGFIADIVSGKVTRAGSSIMARMSVSDTLGHIAVHPLFDRSIRHIEVERRREVTLRNFAPVLVLVVSMDDIRLAAGSQCVHVFWLVRLIANVIRTYIF